MALFNKNVARRRGPIRQIDGSSATVWTVRDCHTVVDAMTRTTVSAH